jgi:nitrate reductase gamma subunit
MYMSFLTVLFAGLFYAATAIFVVGLTLKIRTYARTPAPLKIPTTPAPTTKSGVVLRMTREVVLFESLFKSNKWIWMFGYLFHGALLLVTLRHLRYFTEPVWAPIEMIQPFGMYAGFAMVAGLGGLWARRFLVDRVRYISTPSDHLILMLLIAIGLSGLGMTFVAHTDIVAVKAFILGLMVFDLQPLPADPVLLVHLTLVALLMIIFPISKLLHAPGIFFSPTRNQTDDSRDRRHLSPWAAKLESGTQSRSDA